MGTVVCSSNQFDKKTNMQIIISQNAYLVNSTTTVPELKALVENQEFLPSHLVRLVSGDTELTEGTLSGNGVEEDEEIDLLLEIPGGMRKNGRRSACVVFVVSAVRCASVPAKLFDGVRVIEGNGVLRCFGRILFS